MRLDADSAATPAIPPDAVRAGVLEYLREEPCPGGSQPPIAPPARIRTERGLFRGISHVSVHHGRDKSDAARRDSASQSYRMVSRLPLHTAQRNHSSQRLPRSDSGSHSIGVYLPQSAQYALEVSLSIRVAGLGKTAELTTGGAFVGLRILNKSSRRKILVSFIAIPPDGTHGTAAFPHFMEKHIARIYAAAHDS